MRPPELPASTRTRCATRAPQRPSGCEDGAGATRSTVASEKRLTSMRGLSSRPAGKACCGSGAPAGCRLPDHQVDQLARHDDLLDDLLAVDVALYGSRWRGRAPAAPRGRRPRVPRRRSRRLPLTCTTRVKMSLASSSGSAFGQAPPRPGARSSRRTPRSRGAARRGK